MIPGSITDEEAIPEPLACLFSAVGKARTDSIREAASVVWCSYMGGGHNRLLPFVKPSSSLPFYRGALSPAASLLEMSRLPVTCRTVKASPRTVFSAVTAGRSPTIKG